MTSAVRELFEQIAPAVSPEAEHDVPRRLIWVLGVGVFGLTWSMTTVVTYLPRVLASFTSSRIVIGAVLAAEGLVAVTVPLVVGPLSDRTWTRLGRRRPFMLAALPPMAAALVFLTLVGGLLPTAVVLAGLLLSVWKTLPFALAAVIVLVSGVAAIVLVDERRTSQTRETPKRFGQPWHILRHSSDVRSFVVVNAAWEATFAGMRTFVVLYIVEGLRQPTYVASAVLGIVASGYLVAAATAGRLGDRIGTARVIAAASLVYGGGLIVGVFPTDWHWLFLGVVFVVAIAAGTVMTLAWSLLYKVMPDRDRGATTGLGSMTKGLGLMIGPALVGVRLIRRRGFSPPPTATR